MKRILKWLAGLFGAIVLLIIIAGVVVMLVVDRKFIEGRMESALHRHVTIRDISVGIFAVVSGIEVKEVRISNYKSERELEALKGKPVADNDLFVGLDSFKFKLEFMPILKKRFVLKELTLYGPKINVVCSESGVYNFDDLLQPRLMTAGERDEAEKKKKEEAAEAAKKAQKPAEPLTADSIPVALSIGKIGLEKGTLTYTDRKFKQTFQVYNLTALVHSIEIDPRALDKKDSLRVKIGMNLKTVGEMKSGTVQSFDIALSAEGSVKPFDLKTRKLDPEISLRLGSPGGTMTGLQIFEKMKDVEALAKYCGKLSFLKKSIAWKNAFVNVWYKAGLVKLSDGAMTTDDYRLAFGGSANIGTRAVDMHLDMILAEKHQKSIRDGLQDNVGKAIKAAGAQVAKYVKAEKVTEAAMKPLLDRDGKVYLKYQVRGTLGKPDARLVEPKLPTMKDLVKDAAKDLAGAAADRAKEAVDQKKDEAMARAEKESKKEGKKALKSLKKKIP